MRTVGLARLNVGRAGAFSLGDPWYSEDYVTVPYTPTENYSDAAMPGYNAPSTVPPPAVAQASEPKDARLPIAVGIFLILLATGS